MPEGISTKEGATPDPAGKAPEPKPTPPKADGGKPLGPNGEKALESERTARKELEKQIQQLQQGQADQVAAIAAAFGIKTEGAKPDDVVSTLQEQVSEMQHERIVSRVARKHQITDDDDVEILSSAKDEQAMERLAARLAAKADSSGPGTPKPDLTQGGKAGDSKGGSTAEQFAAALEDVLGN